MSDHPHEKSDETDQPDGDLPTAPAEDAKPGEDAGGVADTGAPTDPENPTG